MISAKDARKIANKGDEFRLRDLKRINESIEFKIKNAAKRGNFYIVVSILERYEKEVVLSLKEAGYKVKIEDYHSEWSGNYFEIIISW